MGRWYLLHHKTLLHVISSVNEITVFSNCDEVRLFRNHHLIGKQMRKERTPLYRSIVEKGGSPCYVFNAGTYEAGELVAEGIVDGKVVATHSVRTPEQPRQVKIWLKEENIQPVADGSDMIRAYRD